MAPVPAALHVSTTKSKVKELRAEGGLDQALQGAAALAQDKIDRLKRQGYQEHEAREVVLHQYILLPEEPTDDDQAAELAEMEAAYQRNPPPFLSE